MIKLACAGPALSPETDGSGATISLRRRSVPIATPARATAKISVDRH